VYFYRQEYDRGEAMNKQQGPPKLAQSERQAILVVLGFTPQQSAGLLEQGVTVEQLRGMLQLKQYEGAPADVLAEIAAQIDRIEGFEKLALDSHTA
jgi:hypothetical protein